MNNLKYIFTSLLFLIPSLSVAQLGFNSMRNSGEMAEKTKFDPTKENILKLGDELIGVENYNLGSLEEVLAIQKITSTLLAIPGHARYYEERILERQKLCGRAAQQSGRKNDYDRVRGRAFVTLSHLPSPETVGVLGRMLLDDKDFPTDEMNRPRLGGISMSVPGNPDLAMKALEKIGLRNMPEKQEFPKLDPDDWRSLLADPARRDLYPHPLCEQWYEMRGWRLWWDDVKNGRKTFSFKGQAVEYRFKPDGTWETLAMSNPPDDGPGRPDAGESRPERRPGTTAAHMNQPDRTIKSSPWLLAASALLLGAAFWWLMRKTHGADRRNQ